jgi:GcrA cell cycle regulator
MGQAQRSWTADENVRLRQLWSRGLSHVQIAEELGRDRISVQAKCLRIGLRHPKPDFWTAEREQILRDGWAAGHFFSQIAADLGCSKNSCVAKAHRLGLKGKTIARGAVRKRRERVEPAAPDLPIPINFKGVSLLDLEPGMCRYPQGEGLDTLFCGSEAVSDTSWCRTCLRIVYAPRQANRLDGRAA